MKKRLCSWLLVLVMLLGMLPVSTMATSSDDGTVYISISFDGKYITDKDGNYMARVPIKISDVAEINLEEYEALESVDGTSRYSLDRHKYDSSTGNTGKDAAKEDITALHLFIYVHTVLLNHGDMDDVTISGAPGSIYFNKGLFGFKTENLTYYLNGLYPYPENSNAGLTADQIVLEDGQFFDVASFTCFSFFYNPGGGYLYFMDNLDGDPHVCETIKHEYTVAPTKELTVTLGVTYGGFGGPNSGAGGGMVAQTDTTWHPINAFTHTDISGTETKVLYYNQEGTPLPIYCATKLYATDAKKFEVDENGQATLSFEKPGTYYIWADGACYDGGDYGCWCNSATDGYCIVSAPAYAVVTVTDGEEEPSGCNHNWTAATCTVSKICSICGATEGEANGHSWTDATCIAPKTCSICKATEGEANGHTWTDATCTAPKTCSVCKATEGEANGHTWTDATCTTPKTCSVCKATEGEANGHTWNDHVCSTCQIKDDDLTVAAEAEEQIAAIGKVTLNSETAITKAREKYDALTDTQKALVGNYSVLTDAETALINRKAAAAVEEKIAAIGAIGSNSEQVAAAREAYDALAAEQKALVENYYALVAAESANYLAAQAKEKAPIVSSTSGEWQVLGLARAGVSADEKYFDEYYANVVRCLDNVIDPATGRLDPNKSTDNSRVILALTAIGRDVTDVGGYNLLKGLSDINYVGRQGINGTVFALIALDSHGYDIPENADSSKQTTRELLIERILAAQYANGKWPIMDDMTPMALQALAPYKNDPKVAAAIEKAIAAMEASMMDTSETYAQMIVQLSALGEDAAEFILDGKSVLDRMLEYYVGNGAFAHTGTAANQMATEQAFYALVAYDRYKSGTKTSLYDMTDVVIDTSYEAAESVTGVTLDRSTLEIKAERNKTLTALVDPADAKERTVTWTSSNPNIATVSSTGKISAKVTGVSAGTATITAKVGGKTATCTVKVTGNNSSVSTPVLPEEKTITVTMRLIGAELAAQDVNLSKTEYLPNYVTWLPTTKYTLEEGATVYDLWVAATEDAGIESIGADNNYVETVYAPAKLGGYELSEFTNGARSGWMYTINGSHPGFGLCEQGLSDGDVVIWHYVNDYAHEVEDWFDEAQWPSLGDGTYYNFWLKAPNRLGGKGGGIGSPVAPKEEKEIEITVPVIGSDSTVEISATVEGTKVTVEKMDLLQTDTLEDTGILTIDFSALDNKEPVTAVALPAESIKQLATANSNADKDAPGLEIVLPGGASITFDGAALKETAAQADASDITVSIEDSKTATLTNAQKKSVGTRPAFDIHVTSADKKISNMGGKITIGAPYELLSGEKPTGIVVWYVDDQGNKERCTTSYDSTKKCVYWQTDHLSLYMVDYDEALAKNSFADISMDHYFFDAVLWAVEKGITTGTSTTTFSPDAVCSRAQMVTFLWRAAGCPQAASTTCAFTDVVMDSYYYDALLWAVENGITTGTSATTFSPDAPCSRGQMALFLYRNAESPAVTGNNFFDDVSDTAYYKDAVNWAKAEGITTGTSASSFSPDADCTRGQMVTFLYRHLKESSR